jgi:hypothetical protein
LVHQLEQKCLIGLVVVLDCHGVLSVRRWSETAKVIQHSVCHPVLDLGVLALEHVPKLIQEARIVTLEVRSGCRYIKPLAVAHQHEFCRVVK